MNIDEITILQYVENQLDEHDAKAFEKLMENDAELRQQVHAMRSSQLPYQAAFADEETPDLPDHLQEQVQQLTQVAQGRGKTQGGRRQVWLVASICLAFLCGWAASTLLQTVRSPQAQLVQNDWPAYGGKALIDAMIQYQALYTRTTVAQVQQMPVDTAKVIQRFNQAEQRELSVPQLPGYQFRRAQELAFNGKTIVQMVYLAESGKPVALCVTRSDHMQRAAIDYDYAGMNSFIWVNNGLTYMLMADKPQPGLRALFDHLNG